MPDERPSRERPADELGFDAARRLLDDLEAGDGADGPRIGDYVVLRRLGGGGGGEVFQVIREGADRPLALKLLRHRLGEGRAARRIWRELDVLGQIRSPCLPQLLDHGRHEDRLFLVTEYIDGAPLADHCDRRDLDRAARVALLADVADAVQTLHEHGVIHRDVKPSNVLVTDRGQPVLIDLGVATLLATDATETLTPDGEPVGSPAFMAPEQARGEHAAVSTRSDVYGLGATALVVLTGESPHHLDGPLSEAIRRVAYDPPRDPRALDPTLPRPLAAVLRKALASRPAERYASAGAFAEDLRRWERGEPVEAGPPSPLRRLARRAARHPVATTLAACLGVAALTIASTLVSVWWLNAQPYRLRTDQQWVHLVSRAGRILHTWEAGPDQILLAETAERDATRGGGRVVLIAFRLHPDPAFENRLCAFPIDDPETLLWSSGAGPPDVVMPAPITRNEGDRYRAEIAFTADVFPDAPGVEVVVVHRLYTWSACAVRVHDLEGRVLYEVWHDGGLVDAVWHVPARQLVLCGFNSEALWSQRGHGAGSEAMPRPIVVFALRPGLGEIHHAWIRTPGGRGTIASAWYRCLFPPDRVAEVAGERPSIDLEGSRLGRIMLSIRPDEAGPDLSFVLDAEGRLVERIVSDRYKATPGLPDPDELTVTDLPPIEP